MKSKLILTALALSFTLVTTANARVARVDVKDIKDTARRARVAEDVARSVRDITGSERLSSLFEGKINDAARLDGRSQGELATSINAALKGLETASRRGANQINMSKVEDIIASNLNAAVLLRANSFQNETTSKIAEALFNTAGLRMKAKLENPQISYDFDLMQRLGEITLAKLNGRRSLNEKEVEELNLAFEKELKGKVEDYNKCRD